MIDVVDPVRRMLDKERGFQRPSRDIPTGYPEGSLVRVSKSVFSNYEKQATQKPFVRYWKVLSAYYVPGRNTYYYELFDESRGLSLNTTHSKILGKWPE